jgi:hypothetical protein
VFTQQWISVDGIRTLEEKIKEFTGFVGSGKLMVVLVVDPKSSPEEAGKIVEALLKRGDLELTLIFGRRTGEHAEIKRK